MGRRCYGGKGALVLGEERDKHIGDLSRKTFSQRHWMGKQEGLIFMSFYNQWNSKIGVLETSHMAGVEP